MALYSWVFNFRKRLFHHIYPAGVRWRRFKISILKIFYWKDSNEQGEYSMAHGVQISNNTSARDNVGPVFGVTLPVTHASTSNWYSTAGVITTHACPQPTHFSIADLEEEKKSDSIQIFQSSQLLFFLKRNFDRLWALLFGSYYAMRCSCQLLTKLKYFDFYSLWAAW